MHACNSESNECCPPNSVVGTSQAAMAPLSPSKTAVTTFGLSLCSYVAVLDLHLFYIMGIHLRYVWYQLCATTQVALVVATCLVGF